MTAKFSIAELINLTGGIPAGTAVADPHTILVGVSTDTRTVSAGEVFFALIGENHDAHDHLSEAIDRGAALLVISDAAKIPVGLECAAIVVSDTLRAYQDLAAYYRKQRDPFVIAVTGSVGKTTLKDMLVCVLSGHARVHGTQGNLNNQIGLPRTILSAADDTEIMVLEMGMAYSGEIGRLAEIALPDVSAITNIGISHRENFDTDDGIIKAKYEIATFLGKDGTLVIDAGGNAELAKLASDGSREKGYKLLRVAQEGLAAAEDSDYTVSQTRVSETDAAVTLFEIKDGRGGAAVSFAVPIPGAYAGISAAMTSAVCACAGVTLADSAKALENLKRTSHRLDPVWKNGVLVIDDTYNASPDSVKSGLDYLRNVPATRRVAVLADMNGLGGDSEAMHRKVGAEAARLGTDRIYTFGDKARQIADGAKVVAGNTGVPEIFHFEPGAKEVLIRRLCEDIIEGDAVYIKGSRSMKMEDVVRALTKDTPDVDV